MGLQKQFKIYRLENRIRQVNKNVIFFHYVVPIVHLIFLVILLLINIRSQFKQSMLPLQQILNFISSTIFTYQLAQLYIILGNIIYFFITGFSIIRLNLIPNLNEIAKHKQLQRFLFITTVSIVYITHFVICLIVWSFTLICLNQGIIMATLKCIFPFFGYIYYTFKYQTISLYDWLTVPIILFINFIPTTLSYLIVISISIYLIFRKKNIIKKVCYGFIIILAFFVMKNSQLSEESDSSKIVLQCACLGIAILLSPIVINNMYTQIQFSNLQQRVDICFTTLKQLKSDKPYQQMKFNQFYALYQEIIGLICLHNGYKSKQIDVIIQKVPQSMTKIDFFMLLQRFTQQQSKQSNTNRQFRQIILLKIKIALNRSPFSIIKDVLILSEQIQKSNKKYLAQYFSLYEQLVNKYGAFKQKQLQIAHIISINKLKNDFQNKTYFLFNKLNLFWQRMNQKNIRRSILDRNLDQVLMIEQDLNKVYLELKVLGNVQKQQKILQITKNLLNCYLQQQKIQKLQVNKLQKINQDTNFLFIILQENIIKFISNDLLKSLEQKNGLIYQNYDKKVLFGQEFVSIVNHLILNMTVQSQSQWITIPILLRKGIVQIKKIKIMWYPCFQSKYNIMIRFSSQSQLDKNALLIYNNETNTVKYINKKFADNFNINLDLFNLNNSQLFLNELFIDCEQSIQKIKSIQKQKQKIKCKIYLKNYVNQNIPHIIPVQIKVAKQTQIDKSTQYTILKINKLKQQGSSKNSQLRTNTSEQKSSIIYLEQNQIKFTAGHILANNYANERFFCKIPNNYQNKIMQKQSQLDHSQRWVYRYFIHILFGLIFTSILTFWLFDYKMLQGRIQKYKQYITAIQNTSQQYTLIYQSYTMILGRYYLQKYLMKNFINAFLPWFILDLFYVQMQQIFLQQFLNRYLIQLNSQPNKPINYELNYDFFSVKTTTEESTFMDFASNLKNHMSNSQYEFFFRNYDNYRDLSIKYEDSLSVQQLAESIVVNSELYFFLLMFGAVFILIMILIIIIKIQSSMGMIYELIKQIQNKKIQQHLNKVQQQQIIINNIMINYLTDNKNNLEYNGQKRALFSLNKKQSNISNQYSFKQQLRSNSKLSQSIQLSNNQYITNRHSIHADKQNILYLQQQSLQNINSHQSFSFNSNINKSIKKSQEPTKLKIIHQSVISKFQNKLLFIFIFIILTIFLYFDYFTLQQQKLGLIQLFNIKRKIYVTMLHIKRQQIDAQIMPNIQHYYNKSLSDPYHLQKINLITVLPNQIILDQLKGLDVEVKKILQTNMCQYYDNSTGLAMKPCETYLQGIVAKGFTQTYDLYFQNAKILASKTIQTLDPYNCSIQYCSPYAQHLMASVLMGNTVRKLINKFNQMTDIGFQKMIQIHRIRTFYKVLALLGGGIFYFLWSNNFKKKCLLSIKYFKIIPKNIMCSMKITSFLRKNNILNKLDIL